MSLSFAITCRLVHHKQASTVFSWGFFVGRRLIGDSNGMVMALQDMGNVDTQSGVSYITGAIGLVLSGATLLQLFSTLVGILLGIVSIICIILTYRSTAERNRSQLELSKAQTEALLKHNSEVE